MHSFLVVLTILFIFQSSPALEYNKQQTFNTNTDFLLHEGGVSQNGFKKDKTASQAMNSNTYTSYNMNLNTDKRDYIAQFPPLKPQSISQTPTNSIPLPNSQSFSGKRDYVGPQPTTTSKPIKPNNQQSTGNIGNYASQFPALPTQHSNLPSTNKIRDYMAPQLTTPKSAQQINRASTGKIKDLINYYDNKNKGVSPPNGAPSYSNILQSGSNGQSTSTTKFTRPTSSTSITRTTKPMGLSSVVAVTTKPGNQVTPPKSPGHNNPSLKPGSPVLPSAILNNNRGSTNGNIPTDAELQTLSEELLRKDSNNAAKFITINYQEKTTSQSKEDKAPQPLITVSPEVWNIATIQKFVPLLDNYERDTLINEYVTPQERNEENAFMDVIMATSVMRHLMTFLKNKGYVTPDPQQQRDFVKQLWFGLYSRGKGKISSSGFEHIFVSELKNGDVSGLHNWIYFAKEEAANRINYLGYLKYLELNDKGAVMKIHFNQQGVDKPVNSLLVGTSPELEMAVYTLCFVTRSDNECKLKLANKDIEIVTHTFRYRSKNYIGSAYPSI